MVDLIKYFCEFCLKVLNNLLNVMVSFSENLVIIQDFIFFIMILNFEVNFFRI